MNGLDRGPEFLCQVSGGAKHFRKEVEDVAEKAGAQRLKGYGY
jgi:hypothetical protein